MLAILPRLIRLPGRENRREIDSHGPVGTPHHFINFSLKSLPILSLSNHHNHSPGFGLHAPTPHSQRLSACEAATKAILAHLHVRHVAFLSASAGTIYLLGSLPSLRTYLHPRHPYISAMVPWVHPSFSHCKLLDTASRLPYPLISAFGGLQKFMVRNVVPSVAWSGGVVEQIGSLFGKKAEEQEENAESRETYLRCFGVGEGLKDEAENAAIKYLFTEGT